MSFISKLRKKVGYTRSVPVCENCRHFKEPYVFLTTNSMTRESEPQCLLHHFNVLRTAKCSKWTAIKIEVVLQPKES